MKKIAAAAAPRWVRGAGISLLRNSKVLRIGVEAPCGLRTSLMTAALLVGCFATLGAVVRSDGANTAVPAAQGGEAVRIADRMRGLRAALQALAAEDSVLSASMPVLAASGPGATAVRTALPPESPVEAAQTGAGPGTSLYDAAALLRRVSDGGPTADEAWKHYEERSQRWAAIPSIAPSAGALSSPFDRDRLHPVLRIRRPHRGIDIAAPRGTPILAPARGQVRFAGSRADGYGRTVEIDHGGGIVTRFAHASRLLVRTGQQVERGQRVAEVGASGLATGPHLHYEVLVGGRQVDPLQFVGRSGAMR